MTSPDKIAEGLSSIEMMSGVRILMAVESGSRAWGFPSPDSDYDIRFIYVRPLKHYLSLDKSRRDTLEFPIKDNLDFSGFDLDKALSLIMHGNATVLEWITSPIVYHQDKVFVSQLSYVALQKMSKRALRGHYYGQCMKLSANILYDSETLIGKRYFYVLRPALVLRWLRERGGLPPMNILKLLELAPDDIRVETLKLIDWKKLASEKEVINRIPILDEFIQSEMALALPLLKEEKPSPANFAAADKLLYSYVVP